MKIVNSLSIAPDVLKQLKSYVYDIIGCCQEVHKESHKHFMDFLCKGNVVVECKAITSIGAEQRQQLWNYMRLTNTPMGILYNFAPVKDQCEKYYYDVNTKTISVF